MMMRLTISNHFHSYPTLLASPAFPIPLPLPTLLSFLIYYLLSTSVSSYEVRGIAVSLHSPVKVQMPLSLCKRQKVHSFSVELYQTSFGGQNRYFLVLLFSLYV